MNNEKIISYAIAYLENKIDEHNHFLNNYEGNKEELAQFDLVKRYGLELNELQLLLD